MPRTNIEDLTPEQRTQLAEAIKSYVNDSVLLAHFLWHFAPSPRQLETPGGFLMFHRQFIGRLEDHLRDNNLVALPYWSPTTLIPQELFHIDREVTVPNLPLPSWATIEGGLTPDPVFGYTSLLQFRTADELSKALSDYHNLVEDTIGGDLQTLEKAPRDPIFWPWHAFLDEVLWTWEHTISLDQVARGMGVSGDISILRDFFGNPSPPYELSIFSKVQEFRN